MSVFAELETIVSGHLDRVFGDAVILMPRRQGEVSSIADPDREQITVVGIVDFNPRTISPKGKEQYDAFQPNLAGEKVHVSFDVNVFPSDGARPKQGDRLVAMLKYGTLTFEVVTVEADELGRLVTPCKLLGKGILV